MKKMIVMGVAALLLVGASVGGSMFFMGMFNEEPASAAAGPVEEESLPEEILYYHVQPEFVVNFRGKTRMKFMMIEMSVVTRDEEVLTVLSDHDPELRNALLLLLSEQDSEVLKTIEGKQTLQKSAMERIDEVVGKYHRNERVEDVLITRLVMQ